MLLHSIEDKSFTLHASIRLPCVGTDLIRVLAEVSVEGDGVSRSCSSDHNLRNTGLKQRHYLKPSILADIKHFYRSLTKHTSIHKYTITMAISHTGVIS